MSSRSWQEFITWSQKKQFPVKEQKARNELLFHSSNSLKTHVKLSLVCNTEGSCNLPVLLLAAECYCSHYPSKHMAFLMGIGILKLQKEQQQVNQRKCITNPFFRVCTRREGMATWVYVQMFQDTPITFTGLQLFSEKVFFINKHHSQA